MSALNSFQNDEMSKALSKLLNSRVEILKAAQVHLEEIIFRSCQVTASPYCLNSIL